MSKFTNSATVVSVTLTPHPNADALSVVDVLGSNVVVKTSDWAGKDRGVYIPPENYVDTTRPEFAFLDKEGKPFRIKAVKLRGVQSVGILVPCPEDCEIGQDVTERFCVQHYDAEPAIQTNQRKTPDDPYLKSLPKYDIDSHHKHARDFAGLDVEITEKIHGQNATYCWHNGEVVCRGRTVWVERDKNSTVWRAFYSCPQIETFLKENPELVLWGEVYGMVKHFRYDAPPNSTAFRVFDIKTKDGWMNSQERRDLCGKYELPSAPLLYVGPHDWDKVLECGVGRSTLNTDTLREGCVVKPLVEAVDYRFNRLVYKYVNPEYLKR